MLTITAPIKTVLDNDLCDTGEAFARRIIANYDQMTEFITKEDLFHVVTQPPEVFLMDGGGSSFLSETEVYNTQHKKVEIINNLMNRILVSADTSLTYQDEVYISNVLRKLGVNDVSTFMKKVYELTEESRVNNRLIEAYWDNREQLAQMISQYRIQQGDTRNTESNYSNEEILHLHEDVFKRWMTGAVYRMQNNFRTDGGSVTVVNGDSYRMTEQQRLSQQILLQRLRESVRGEAVPLIYRHDNFYEQPSGNEADLSEEAVASQIASAVLLNLVDNLYENITSKSQTIGDRYYLTQNAYYGAADNVFERMEGNTAYIISEHRDGDHISENIIRSGDEINVINEILEAYQEVAAPQEGVYTGMGAYPGEAEMVYPETSGGEESSAPETAPRIHVDERNTIEQQLYQTNIQNEERRRIYMQNLQRLSRQEVVMPEARTDEDARRAELTYAFEHPEEFRREFSERAEQEAAITEENAQKMIDALPPVSRDVFHIIESYISDPGRFAGSRLVSKDAEMLLVRESIEAERDEKIIRENRRITETIDRNSDTERRVTERLQNVEETVGRITPETVNLVHRVNDVTIDEETIESLRREIKDIRNDTTRVENIVENRENVVERHENTVNEMVVNQQTAENITRMIQDNINSQIGTITGKVYNRIERQLMSERRRRGI